MSREGHSVALKDDSYLPSWILDMRKNLEKSKNASTYADKQITGLLENVADLTSKLKTANEQSKKHHEDIFNQKEGNISRGLNVLDLPDDTLCVIFQFLVVREVMCVESTRKEVRVMIESSNYWVASYGDQIKRFKTSRHPNFRNFIVNKEQCMYSALTFIEVLKEKRSVPRFRNIEPHCYHRSDSGISHPFPVIEEHFDEKGQRSVSNVMMSRVETMNTDFRSFALLSMRDISALTSYEADSIHSKLVKQGSVAVLVSILSNESDVLRQYSCESLANLLCWETRLVLNYERFSYLHSSQSDPSVHDLSSFGSDEATLAAQRGSFKANTPLSHRALRDQLQLCDARRQLSSLLTSPSACVNLAQSRARGRDVNERVEAGGGFSVNRLTSAVQGMSCKAACRVLVNLFSPSDCVPSPHRHFVVFGERKDSTTASGKKEAVDISLATDQASSDAPAESRLVPRPTDKKNIQIAASGQKSCTRSPAGTRAVHSKPMANKDVTRNSSAPRLANKSTPVIVGRNALMDPSTCPPLPHRVDKSGGKLSAPLHNKPAVDTPTPTIHPHPWKFQYYHKSGFEKDTHVVWMQFLDESAGAARQHQELRGRGEDDTGLFFLRGHVNIDIEGFSWHMEKCYIKTPVKSQGSLLHMPPMTESASEAQRVDVGDEMAREVSKDQWIRNESGEWVSRGEILSWGRPHLSHTGFCSTPVTDAVVTEDFVHNQRVAALINLRNCSASAADEAADVPNGGPQVFREEELFYHTKELQGEASRDKKCPSAALSSAKQLERQRQAEYESYVRFNTNWGGGMYGVWEVSTTESHFDLVKGGVFRATPLALS